ncbi:MAG: BON domain-containing protein [Pseudobdellovibrionaceae bacterium]
MKKSILTFTLLLGVWAFAAWETHHSTTMDSESTDSMNTSQVYDNLDQRTNSASTPAQYGRQDSTVESPTDVSSETAGSSKFETTPAVDEAGAPPVYSGSGTDTYGVDANEIDANEARVSGSATEKTSPSAEGTGTAAGAAAAGAGMTAQDTATTKTESETVRKIRSDITGDKSLSMAAHNVKIINQNGQIFLKGPVANSNEKAKVEEIAKRTAGATTVVNQTYVETK